MAKIFFICPFLTNPPPCSVVTNAAIGGIGTERFQIEAIATNNNIPIFSIVVKQSVKEAITLMTKEIADQADNVCSQVYEMIQENTKQGQSVLIIGVGNTAGVPQ